MSRALMFQGTGSDVGKTVLVAGLCRLARNRGIKVYPFKPQNMSNNAAVADDGGEIGRGQWLQAFACGVAPSIHMNPVLLKPQSETGSQIIVQGKVFGQARGADYQKLKSTLLQSVMQSFNYLSHQADLILVEGAGSPAEINLRQGDIANMGFAECANIPVVLIGDIDRGGVIASLVGTKTILASSDCALIVGYLINKFRGDPKLFESGIQAIYDFTSWHCFGVVPWLDDVRLLPAEDSVVLDKLLTDKTGSIKIAVPILPHIANFDDLDPLLHEEDVELCFLKKGDKFPNSCDLILLLGSKSTIADMQALQNYGWADAVVAHASQGGRVLGLCGGFQMLGKTISDPSNIEGEKQSIAGLGLLDITTNMSCEKTMRNVTAQHVATGLTLSGYEIHLGETIGNDCKNAVIKINDVLDGAGSKDQRIWGTYLHGIFADDTFRSHFLHELGAKSDGKVYLAKLDQALDNIAHQLEAVIDIDTLFALAR